MLLKTSLHTMFPIKNNVYIIYHSFTSTHKIIQILYSLWALIDWSAFYINLIHKTWFWIFQTLHLPTQLIGFSFFSELHLVQSQKIMLLKNFWEIILFRFRWHTINIIIAEILMLSMKQNPFINKKWTLMILGVSIANIVIKAILLEMYKNVTEYLLKK